MSESWARAMLIAYGRCQESRAEGGERRYRVYGYPLGDGRWAYAVGKPRKPPVEIPSRTPIVMSDELFAQLADAFPRCAQRALGVHGGGSKVAITDQWVAKAMAAYVCQRAYPCDLPAPAIGRHWHLSTAGKRRKWMP